MSARSSLVRLLWYPVQQAPSAASQDRLPESTIAAWLACDYLIDELGFDAAIDYKSEDLRKALRGHCPEGVDVFFDNVGGDTLNTVLPMLRMHGRVVICGAISQYNNTIRVP